MSQENEVYRNIGENGLINLTIVWRADNGTGNPDVIVTSNPNEVGSIGAYLDPEIAIKAGRALIEAGQFAEASRYSDSASLPSSSQAIQSVAEQKAKGQKFDVHGGS